MHRPLHRVLAAPLHSPRRWVRVSLLLGLYSLLALGCSECDLVCTCTRGCDCTEGCCGSGGPVDRRGCGCSRGTGLVSPLDSVVAAHISSTAADDAELAMTLCGWETPGLLGVSARRVPHLANFGGYFRVELHGLPRPPIDAVSAATAPPIEEQQPCSGILWVEMRVFEGTWSIFQTRVVKVHTPGVERSRRSDGRDLDLDLDVPFDLDDLDFDDWD